MSLSSQYYMLRWRINARRAMLMPVSMMTERRRKTLADYLGYRDVYQDRDGHWMGKQGVTSGNGPSGFWWALPNDRELVNQAKRKWKGLPEET